MPVQAATAIISTGTQIAGTIAGFRDARARTLFEQNLSLLDYDQKQKLNNELIKANSEDARQAILASTLGGISKSRVDSFGAIALEREKTNKIVTILGVVTGVGVLTFILFQASSKK